LESMEEEKMEKDMILINVVLALHVIAVLVTFYMGHIGLQMLSSVGVIIGYMTICFEELKETIIEERNDG